MILKKKIVLIVIIFMMIFINLFYSVKAKSKDDFIIMNNLKIATQATQGDRCK